MTSESLGTYEELAEEYYDASRHPTCANFRQASAVLLRKWSSNLPSELGSSCEIGPGRSLLAEFRTLGKFSTRALLLVDSSPSMLEHSRFYSGYGQRGIIGAATALPVKDDSVEFVASFLGDPYNVPEFWREVYRVLKVGGKFVFTTPSYEWASAFRAGLGAEEKASAEFLLSNGRKVFVPSFILPEKKQRELIASANFQILDFAGVRASDLGHQRLSPKLMVNNTKELVVVTGYLCEKRRAAK
jgi:SAM-dependent methyltransferase